MKKNAVIAVTLFVFVLALAMNWPKLDDPEVENPEKKETVILPQKVVFLEEPDQAKALKMLEAGDMLVYAYGLSDPELKRQVEASDELISVLSYGGSWELTFNPVRFGEGKINPFSVPAIRSALNQLLDRKYICEEIFVGLAKPKFFPMATTFPDYARLIDIAIPLELQYAHNPEKAREVISREMHKLGATLQEGKWQYNGKPVEIIFLIRVEDKRKQVGDYVATLLENVGFTVERQYKTADEASPLWIGGDPAEGKWHVYTGGWISPLINRDQAGNFNYYYTPKGRPDPLWQAYKPSPRFEEIADILARRDYKTWDERQKLMAEALELSMEDSVRIWLVDNISFFPRRSEVEVVSDLAGGVNGSSLWPYTLRLKGEQRPMTVGMPSILTEPWNPVAGSNWIYDQMIQRGTTDEATLPDPYTGLFIANLVKSAELTVQEGLPINKTLDWVALSFAPTLDVPADAWLDWDVDNQRFISVAEKHPEGLNARTKTVVRFVDGLYQRKWHDETNLSMADFVASFILGFARVKEKSPIFDESAKHLFKPFADHFRGVRVTQEKPLIVEIYTDQIFPDAEWIANWAADLFYTATPWHSLAIGILAEEENQLAFSASKASKNKTEWMNYIAGPSLTKLEESLRKAENKAYLPFKTLAKYVTRDEAKARYAKLRQWYNKKGHFWVGQGPYYVDSVHTIEKNIVLSRFEQFDKPDPRWLKFAEPRIADVTVNGPSTVKIGHPAKFQVDIEFQSKPYQRQDMDFIVVLLFDGADNLVFVDKFDKKKIDDKFKDGQLQVMLPAEKMAELHPGSYRLEIAVTSHAVSIVSLASITFATLGDR
jgi:peptide/nickel transport system substrate-binding protein